MTNTNGFATKVNPQGRFAAEAPHTGGAELSEAEMLARAKAGDREALEELLAAARPRLCAVALKMLRNTDDAEDVVQEAMLKVWRYVGRFEGRAALSTWLHRILVNTAVDHLRARKNGPVAARSTDGDVDDDHRSPEGVDDETPEELLGRQQVGVAVRGAMAHLSPVHRDVLALRELEGESYQDIAVAVRCPIGTVMSRLHHARHRLAETLSAGYADLLPQAA